MTLDNASAPEDEVPIDELLADLVLDDSDDGWGDVDDREGDSAVLGVIVVNWRTLNQQPREKTVEAWTELGSWVSWLVNRYDIPTEIIPECWLRHGGTVEELSALHSCWKASFDDSDSGYGPIGFHERLHIARDRLRKSWPASCTRAHTETPTRLLKQSVPEWL